MFFRKQGLTQHQATCKKTADSTNLGISFQCRQCSSSFTSEGYVNSHSLLKKLAQLKINNVYFFSGRKRHTGSKTCQARARRLNQSKSSMSNLVLSDTSSRVTIPSEICVICGTRCENKEKLVSHLKTSHFMGPAPEQREQEDHEVSNKCYCIVLYCICHVIYCILLHSSCRENTRNKMH